MIRGKPTGMSAADWKAAADIPKNVLYAMAKHMAAQLDPESYDESIAEGRYLARMLEEWRSLHLSGIVTQVPPRSL